MKRFAIRARALVCLIAFVAGIAPAHAAVTERPDGMVLCQASDTYTLPTAVGRPGRVYRVKNTGTTTACTVATASAQTIDGLSTWSVQSGQLISFTADNGNWLCSQSAAEAKLQTLANMFVVGDGSNLLTPAEIAEDVALLQTQQTTVPNQDGPGSAASGFVFKDLDGKHKLLSLGGQDQGLTVWSKISLGGAFGTLWERAARFGYVDPGSQGHVQQLYDVVQMYGADFNLTRGYTIGGLQPKAAMVHIQSDLPDGDLFPGGAAVLDLVTTGSYNTSLIRGYDFSGAQSFAVSQNGGLLPSGGAIPRATGGVLSIANNYLFHDFTVSGTLAVTTEVVADVFVLPSGAGGGVASWASGGGAGGLRKIFSGVTLTVGDHTVTVGASAAAGQPGNASSFDALTQAVSGQGGTWNAHVAGYAGACGGGGAMGVGGNSAGAGGAATGGLGGYAGGSGYQGVGQQNYSGGGGAGAGAAGGNVNPATPHLAANGGAGVLDNFTGTWQLWGAGGGGGNGDNSGYTGRAGLGGLGGGGNGGYADVDATAGAAGTGSGGGGSGHASHASGASGSGRVIVRYAAMP